MSGAVAKGDNDRAIADYSKAFYNVVRAGPGSISTPGDWQFRFEANILKAKTPLGFLMIFTSFRLKALLAPR